MRVLMIPAAAAGHFFPMVPLAWALRTAGHEVCIGAQPAISDVVLRTGLNTVVVGESYDLMGSIAEADREVRAKLGRSPATFAELAAIDPAVRKWHGELRTAPHAHAAAAMSDGLVEFARAWRPDVVVSDPITLVAPLVAELVGAPLVHHQWGPAEPSLDKFAGYGAPVERWHPVLRALYERFGVEARTDYSPFSIASCPPSLQTAHPENRHTTRYVPHNGSGALAAWTGARPERPRVCVSWSTSKALNRDGAEHPVTAITRALARLDVELVVTVAADDRAAVDVPDGVRLVSEMPLQAVLPSCAASVNTGGAGSILTVLAAHGLPQVVVPQGPGHAFNAERVAAVGAGIGLGFHPADVADPAHLDELTESVSAVLTEERYAKAAEDVRQENLAQPALADAVRRLEELV
jgi:UDP:flavonoid glycosyltransferase YjiC (YdhE family)